MTNLPPIKKAQDRDNQLPQDIGIYTTDLINRIEKGLDKLVVTSGQRLFEIRNIPSKLVANDAANKIVRDYYIQTGGYKDLRFYPQSRDNDSLYTIELVRK